MCSLEELAALPPQAKPGRASLLLGLEQYDGEFPSSLRLA